VQTTSHGVVAREHELVVIDEFVLRAATSGGSLAIRGPAGIGKTALFDACIAGAARAGIRVLTSRPAEAESGLPYAALADLLGPTYAELAGTLAEPLRRALDVALLRQIAPAGGQDRLAVAIAVRDSVLALADGGPILLAIDDLQWLDPESAFALGYALRRTAGHHVGVVATVRVAADPPPAALSPVFIAPAVSVTVTSLDPRALGTVLSEKIGTTYLPHTLERIHSASAGNPFHALEIAHALEVRGVPLALDEPLPVPLTLQGLLTDRLRSLSPSASRTLLAAAALARPTASVLRAGFGDGVDDDIVAAQQQGIVTTRGDDVVFCHPLFAGAAYRAAPAGERRAVHGRLAAALSDEFEHARHRALSLATPDETVAALVSATAEAAAHQGAIGVAATLAREAVRLTSETDVRELAARTIRAAELRSLAGVTIPSDELTSLLKRPLDDATRMRVLAALAYSYGNDFSASRPLVEEIVRLTPGLDDASAVEAHLEVSKIIWTDSLPRALTHIRSALERARSMSDPGLVARAGYDLAVTLLSMGSPESSAAIEAVQTATADKDNPDVYWRSLLRGWQPL
jgi:AAA ATPase domain